MIGNPDRCFLCGSNGNGDRLEEHHIFGGASRKNSTKYGLTVMLCGCKCHRLGKLSAHVNKDTRIYLRKIAQKHAMEKFNLTTEEFIKLFGKNYL